MMKNGPFTSVSAIIGATCCHLPPGTASCLRIWATITTSRPSRRRVSYPRRSSRRRINAEDDLSEELPRGHTPEAFGGLFEREDAVDDGPDAGHEQHPD